MAKELPVIPQSLPIHDNTMMSAWSRCPRYYKLRHIQHLRPKGQSAALGWGSMLHEGLATWYETWDREQALQAIMDYPFEDSEDDYRTKGRALVKMDEYINWWGKEENRLGGPENVLMTETPFEVTDEEGFSWGGRLDLVVLYKGNIWMLDHKTTSRNDSMEKYKSDPQMAGYVWAASQLHGKPVSGAIINRIVIHKNPKPPEQQLMYKPFLFPEWKLEEWRASMIEAYKQIAQAREEDNFPPRYHNCVNKYGRCPYFDACHSPPGRTRERILEHDFVEEEWDFMAADL